MSFVLLVIGLLAAAIGVIMVGFGIPINEFSLGNTLIIAGTTALMGGLIVIGLALALRQLINLTEALSARPSGAVSLPGLPPVEPTEPAAPRTVSPRMPMPVPARPDVPPARAPRMPEPRIAESPAGETVESPVSPRQPVRPAAADDAQERPSWRPPRSAAPEPAARREPPRATPPAAPPVASSERRSPEAAYDAIWPSENRASAPERSEPAASEPRPGTSAEGASSDAKPGARSEPVSVLKSGVVDGMAYTLYTDGSIEAELAQGVIRFGSIDELRNHLEKSAS